MPSRFRTCSQIKLSFFSFQDIITSVTGILILVTLILTMYLNDSGPPPAVPDESPEQKQIAASLAALQQCQSTNLALEHILIEARTAPDTNRLIQDIQNQRQQVQRLERQITNTHLTIAQLQVQAREREQRLGLALLRNQTETNQVLAAQLKQTNALLALKARALELRTVHLPTNDLWMVPDQRAMTKEPVFIVLSGSTISWTRFNRPDTRQEYPAAEAVTRFTGEMNRWNPQKDHLVFCVKPSGIRLFHQFHRAAKDAGFETGHDAIEESRRIQFAPQPGA